MKREIKKPLDQQRLNVAYLDSLYPSGLLRDRQAMVNALRELQSPSLHFGDATQTAGGDASQVVTCSALWASSPNEL